MNAPTYSSTLALQWRAMVAADEAFVLSSWLRSYALSPEMRSLPSPVYHELYAPVVRRLVADADVRIAWDPELPDTVLGFTVGTNGVLHYVFTKRSFRSHGVARWMLKDLPANTVYTSSVCACENGQWKPSECVHPWHFRTRLIKAGWSRDPMARWARRPTNTPEIRA